MSTVNIFEQVSRAKLRFDSKIGSLTAEDLWDLPLTSKNKANLNDIARVLSKQIRDLGEEDFVGHVTSENSELNLSFATVKYVISVRLDENKAITNAAADKTRKDKIRAIIERKKDSEQEALSIEDLEAMLN